MPTRRVRRSRALLDDHMAGHPERERIEAALLQLLGIPAGVPPDELFGAWRAFFEALAAKGTVALVFEDVHWADSGTLDFVDHLVEWSRDLPIFVLTLARPELLDDRPAWGAARRGFTALYLEPLPREAIRALLDGLAPRLPASTAEAIVARAEGVPLYAIETVRMLVSDGRLRSVDGVLEPAGDLGELADLAVPETLTALIAARLDGLPQGDRALLMDAAVLGQSFEAAGLAAVSGRTEVALATRLDDLVRRELLRPIADPRSPERGHFIFVQALIREIAYGTLAKRDRIIAPPRGRALARRHGGSRRSPRRWPTTSLAAHRLLADGPEADDAGRHARSSRSVPRATAPRPCRSPRRRCRSTQQAAALATDPTAQAELLELAGENAGVHAEFDAADALLVRAIEIRRRLDDRQAIVHAAALRARSLLQGRHYEQARSVLDEAMIEFSDLEHGPPYRVLKGQHARLLFLTGELEPSVRLAQQVVDEASRRGRACRARRCPRDARFRAGRSWNGAEDGRQALERGPRDRRGAWPERAATASHQQLCRRLDGGGPGPRIRPRAAGSHARDAARATRDGPYAGWQPLLPRALDRGLGGGASPR